MRLDEGRHAYALSLAAYIGQRLGVATDRIFEGGRGESAVSRARHLLCYVLRERGWTLFEIAAAVQRDHSTVSTAITRIHARLRVDDELRGVYRSMPRSDVRVFTEPSLVDLYNNLTRALAEAQTYAEQIQRRLNEESVPRRVPMPITTEAAFERRIRTWETREALG